MLILKGANNEKSILIVFILRLFLLSSADWLLNSSYKCIKSYYFVPSTGTLYYTLSDTGVTSSITTKSLADDLIDGYEYNATSNKCQPQQLNNTLGLKNTDFNYLNSFVGILVFVILLVSLL